jgi:hypothetical protein
MAIEKEPRPRRRCQAVRPIARRAGSQDLADTFTDDAGLAEFIATLTTEERRLSDDLQERLFKALMKARAEEAARKAAGIPEPEDDLPEGPELDGEAQTIVFIAPRPPRER